MVRFTITRPGEDSASRLGGELSGGDEIAVSVAAQSAGEPGITSSRTTKAKETARIGHGAGPKRFE